MLTHRDPKSLRELNPPWAAPSTPPPDPPPAPENANVLNVILSAGGDILIVFDRPVNVDAGSPPTTWTFDGVSLIAGGFSSGTAAEVVPGGGVSVGDTAVIGGGDPAARTPLGGYVNGITMGVSAG